MTIYFKIFTRNNLRNNLNIKTELLKFMKESYKTNNLNTEFLNKLMQCSNIISTEDPKVEFIFLIKLLEYHFLKKHLKNTDTIYSLNNSINYNDYIVKLMFLFEGVYDKISIAIKSFKDKISREFCEFVDFALKDFPKLSKYYVLRQLKFLPNDESYKYFLIHYFYLNGNFKKSKFLIRVTFRKII